MQKSSNLGLFLLFLFLFPMSLVAQRPQTGATRRWTGGGDGHSWTDPHNWSSVYCYDAVSGVYSVVFAVPKTGDIVDFSDTGDISVTNCPHIILGNIDYNTDAYNYCGVSPSSEINLYAMEIEPYAYVTLDNTIVAGGYVAGNPLYYATALKIDQGRLTCPGLAGNYAQYGTGNQLNMPSIEAINSIIEITNPGTGGLFAPSGRTSFTNCTITCTLFQPYNQGYAQQTDDFTSCTINTSTVYFGPTTIANMDHCIFNLTGAVFSFNSYTGSNNVTLTDVDVNATNASGLTIEYKRGAASMKGNIKCFSTDPNALLAFVNGETNPTPFYLDGNLTLSGGALYLNDGTTLEMTGNLAFTGIVNPNYTKTVAINGTPQFDFGGMNNYFNYNSGPYGPIPGGVRYGLKFSGPNDSHISWPIGFPVDTLTIAKQACAKVYIDNKPLYVTGRLEVNAGQLVVAQQFSGNYGMVTGGDVIMNSGGGIAVPGNTSLAIAGSFQDNNLTVDGTSCNGFQNTAGNTLAFYNTQYTAPNRTIGSLNTASVGNVKFINQSNESFTLQNNFTTDNFDLGGNGKIILGDYSFTVNKNLSNYNSSNYFVSNGTGRLVLPNTDATPIFFPIGNSETSYTPVTILNNGTPDYFGVRVAQGLYSNGNASGNAITNGAVNKTWYVEEATSGNSNVSLSLQWNAVDELSAFDRNDAYLIHYVDANWNFGTSLPVSGNNPYQITRTNLSSFSPFAISNPNPILPLRLLDFTAMKLTGQIALEWKTTNEEQMLGFNLERSEDGRNFKMLGFIKAQNNSPQTNTYNYADQSNHGGTEFYRLKVMSNDGSFYYSRVIEVHSDGLSLIANLFPIPAQDVLNVRFTKLDHMVLHYSIIDATGRTVRKRQEVTSQQLQINVNSLPAGLYYLNIETSTDCRNFKFLKN